MPRPVLKEQLREKVLWISLVSVNVFVFVLCVFVFVTGLWARYSLEAYVDVTGTPSLTRTPLAVAAIGICCSLLTLLGILGSVLLKSMLCRVVLSVYAFVLLFMIVSDLAAGIAAMKYRSELESNIKNNTHQSLNHTYDYNYTSWNDWDSFQRSKKCCGASNYRNFFDIFNTTAVPRSCCTATARHSGQCPDMLKYLDSAEDYKDIHTESCLDVIVPHVQAVLLVLAVIAIVIGVAQVSGVIFSAVVIFSVVRSGNKKTYSYRKLERSSRTSSECSA